MNLKHIGFLGVSCVFVLLPAIVHGQIDEQRVISQKEQNIKLKIPVIQQFSASQTDCQITRGGIFSYQIANQVKQIEIFAVYENGQRRLFYSKMNEPYWNGYSESNIPDPGMDGGIASYLLTAMSPNGQSAQRTLAFRTPKPTFFKPDDRTVSKKYVRRNEKESVVHYEATCRHLNIDHVYVRILAEDVEYGYQPAHSGVDSLSWETTLSNDAAKSAVVFEIQAYGNDGCRDLVFSWKVKVPADR